MKSNRKIIRIVIGVVTIVVILFVINLFISTPESSRPYTSYPTGSSYSTDWDGAELTYRLFEELGFKVQQHHRPLLGVTLPSEEIDVIWHVEGSVPVEQDEIDWVDDWVFRGGSLMLIANPEHLPYSSVDTYGGTSSDYLMQYWLESFGLTRGMEEVTQVRSIDRLSSIRNRIPVGVPIVWPLGGMRLIHSYKKKGLVNPLVFRLSPTGINSSGESFIRDGYGIVVAYSEHGNGKVWIISDPYLFSNMLIQEADNALLATGLVLEARDWETGTILFDEYHLGFVQSRTLADAARTPLGKSIIYLALIAAIAIGTAGARFGPVRKARSAIGVSQRAFVSALAGLWQGADATTAVADALWRRYASRQDIKRRRLDDELDHLRKSRPSVDDLIYIARNLDTRGKP